MDKDEWVAGHSGLRKGIAREEKDKKVKGRMSHEMGEWKERRQT